MLTGKYTHDVVVRAADGARLARALASADTRDAGALETDGAGEAAGVEAEQAQEDADGVLVRL